MGSSGPLPLLPLPMPMPPSPSSHVCARSTSQQRRRRALLPTSRRPPYSGGGGCDCDGGCCCHRGSGCVCLSECHSYLSSSSSNSGTTNDDYDYDYCYYLFGCSQKKEEEKKKKRGKACQIGCATVVRGGGDRGGSERERERKARFQAASIAPTCCWRAIAAPLSLQQRPRSGHPKGRTQQPRRCRGGGICCGCRGCYRRHSFLRRDKGCLSFLLRRGLVVLPLLVALASIGPSREMLFVEAYCERLVPPTWQQLAKTMQDASNNDFVFLCPFQIKGEEACAPADPLSPALVVSSPVDQQIIVSCGDYLYVDGNGGEEDNDAAAAAAATGCVIDCPQTKFIVPGKQSLFLQGLTIRGSRSTAVVVESGGRLRVSGSVFEFNENRNLLLQDGGGAIRGMVGSGIVVDGNTRFFQNQAVRGGAIDAQGSLELREVSFQGNRARQSGGAVYLGRSATLVMEEVTFLDNIIMPSSDPGSSGGDGGVGPALYHDSSSASSVLIEGDLNVACHNGILPPSVSSSSTWTTIADGCNGVESPYGGCQSFGSICVPQGIVQDEEPGSSAPSSSPVGGDTSSSPTATALPSLFPTLVNASATPSTAPALSVAPSTSISPSTNNATLSPASSQSPSTTRAPTSSPRPSSSGAPTSTHSPTSTDSPTSTLSPASTGSPTLTSKPSQSPRPTTARPQRLSTPPPSRAPAQPTSRPTASPLPSASPTVSSMPSSRPSNVPSNATDPIEEATEEPTVAPVSSTPAPTRDTTEEPTNEPTNVDSEESTPEPSQDTKRPTPGPMPAVVNTPRPTKRLTTPTTMATKRPTTPTRRPAASSAAPVTSPTTRPRTLPPASTPRPRAPPTGAPVAANNAVPEPQPQPPPPTHRPVIPPAVARPLWPPTGSPISVSVVPPPPTTMPLPQPPPTPTRRPQPTRQPVAPGPTRRPIINRGPTTRPRRRPTPFGGGGGATRPTPTITIQRPINTAGESGTIVAASENGSGNAADGDTKDKGTTTSGASQSTNGK